MQPLQELGKFKQGMKQRWAALGDKPGLETANPWLPTQASEQNWAMNWGGLGTWGSRGVEDNVKKPWCGSVIGKQSSIEELKVNPPTDNMSTIYICNLFYLPVLLTRSNLCLFIHQKKQPVFIQQFYSTVLQQMGETAERASHNIRRWIRLQLTGDLHDRREMHAQQ
jgi:hypothetical protein